MDSCRLQNIHLVLSGRGLPDWLKDEADLVSEIQDVKHPLQTGGKAMPGIEF
jgi:cob(I)alamin adenosyltransferase